MPLNIRTKINKLIPDDIVDNFALIEAEKFNIVISNLKTLLE
jgi:hypothetical protein